MLIIFIMLCNLITILLHKFFISLNWSHMNLKKHSLFSLWPQPLVTTVLLSVSMVFTILGATHKWNHTVFVGLISICLFVTDISLSIISPRFMHGAACARISFLFQVEWYPLVWIHHILFPILPLITDGHLDCSAPWLLWLMLLWTWL